MPNCERNCGECSKCVGAHAQMVIDEKDAEIAKLNLQSRAMQEIVDAAMNENMPRIRAATKVYQDLQRKIEKRKANWTELDQKNAEG